MSAFEPCPLLDYLEKNPVDLDIDLIREFHDAAGAGDTERVYSYGLLLHQLMFDDFMGEPLRSLPETVRQQTLARSFNAFAEAAQTGYADAMLMTGWCKLMGFGTEEDPAEARIWFDAAAKLMDDDHPQIMLMKKELESRGAAAVPVFN